ncbi:MAG: hypothetical protein C0606_18085 [Hyphomicrobiales bacterium]|nr:MAG: hypothetical protein C0606_18085 [Hyphomicrobiales bacterium]
MFLAATLVWSLATDAASKEALSGARGLARSLGLTDIALFTEARYTRHPTQADLHSAFQDHPFSLEHFPAGTVMPVPDVAASGILTTTPPEASQ